MTQPLSTTTTLTPPQQAAFYAQMTAYQKDEVIGVLFALFFGAFGAHHFYLRRNGLGILYLLFFWTGIPMVLGWIECFFMPGRVRRYNAERAMLVASALAAGWYPFPVPAPAGLPAVQTVCGGCAAPSPAGARFCSRCGRSL